MQIQSDEETLTVTSVTGKPEKKGESEVKYSEDIYNACFLTKEFEFIPR